VIIGRPSLQGIPFDRLERRVGETQRLWLRCRRSEYRRRQNGELGIPFHARRSVRRGPGWLRHNSYNQDKGRCDRNPIAIDFE